MRTFLALVLLIVSFSSTILAADIPASDVTGIWKTLLKSDVRPKTLGEVIFTLRVDSEGIKGGVLLGNFPGYATITRGRIEGDKIFLSATTGPKIIGGRNVDGIRIEFSGTIRNGVLSLTALANEGVWAAKGISVEGRRLP
jgi:hypothetical protein